MHAITQKDVARALGISQATVSRALNNDHRLTAETRERIQTAAREMGYRPSVALSSFASKDHWTNRELRAAPIAVLFGGQNAPQKMRNYQGLENAAEQRGFRLEWRKIAKAQELEGLDHKLYNRGFQGIILGTHRDLQPGWPRLLDLSRFAVVSTDIVHYTEPVTVFHDAARRAVLGGYQRLWERGCRRIGAALWRAGFHPDHGNRLGAFFSAQMEHTGRFEPDSLLTMPMPGEASESDHRAIFQRWVKHYRPDAVILPQSLHWEWLREIDDRMPCISGLVRDTGQPAADGLAGYASDTETLSSLVIQHLEHSIRIRRYGLGRTPVLVSVEGIWREGRSFRADR